MSNLNILVRLISVCLGIVALYSIYSPTQFWTQHPACMILGYAICMINAIISQKERNNKLHIFFQSLGIIFCLYGGYVIYHNKELQNGNHFRSLHSIGGAIVLVLHSLSYFGSGIGELMKIPHWSIHPIIGKIIFSMALVVMFYGYYLINDLSNNTLYFGGFLAGLWISALFIGKSKLSSSTVSINQRTGKTIS